MPLNEPQQREVTQLMLVAQEYLRLGQPPLMSRDTRMGDVGKPLARGTLTATEWSQTMSGAHLASAAIRLASIDHVLEAAKEPRPLYLACRAYFRGDAELDPRGQTCSEWFHVMFRDAVAHNEPSRGASGKQHQRYEGRQRCVEATTYGEAHHRLKKTVDELLAVLEEHGVVLPSVVA